MNVVVMGATGAVGKELVLSLLQLSQIKSVTTLGRRPLEINLDKKIKSDKKINSEKLMHQVVDVFDAKSYEKYLAGNAIALCTLGVGQPSKITKEEFYRVDVMAAADFAGACKRQGVEHFSLLTAVGTNSNSPSYYLRLKGEVEAKVQALGFHRTSFFRPSMILTPTNRYGFSQALTLALFPKIDPLFFGPLRKFRGIRVEDLGRAMALNTLQNGEKAGVEILQWDEFQRILGRNS